LQRLVDGEHEYCAGNPDKHHNRAAGEGGVLMTFADRTCGMMRATCRAADARTVQLDTHSSRRQDRRGAGLETARGASDPSLIFISTEVTVDKRCIAMASGVFKY